MMLKGGDTVFRSSVAYKNLEFRLVEWKHRDDDDWEEWRSGLKGVIGGSDIASLLGFGHTSPRAHLKQIYGFTKKKETTAFTRTCMEHGKKYESLALELLGFPSSCSLGYSAVYEVTRENDPSGASIKVCLSPDYYRKGGVDLIEVKCPYVGSARTFSSAKEFADYHIASRPKGRESYFLQAAFYRVLLNLTLLDGIKEGFKFSVAICFVNNDETAVSRKIDYFHSSFTSNLISNALNKLLNHTSEEEVSKWRVSKLEREDVTRTLSLSYKESFITVEEPISMDGHVLSDDDCSEE